VYHYEQSVQPSKSGAFWREQYMRTTAVWQKCRFSAPQTHLWLIKVWFSASTFVVKIGTFAKPQIVKLSKNPLKDSISRVRKPVVSHISEVSYFKKCKIPSVKGCKISHQTPKVLSLSSPQKVYAPNHIVGRY
jgi:hypothetical protein